MRTFAYHCSPISGLTQLRPSQCKREDSPYCGLFLTPTIRGILIWRGRLYLERAIDPCYLYSVVIDPARQMLFCDGFNGKKKRWRGESETPCNQIWIEQELFCKQEDLQTLLLETTNYDRVRMVYEDLF